ncbi:MAG: hypothetical protein NTU63_03800 [Candidatus Pacearchaeota archaeon]|nr:hypothetical protein [Candidatus Pacearchaeota archaeon]
MKEYHKDFLWKSLMDVGRRNEKGIVNKLTENDIRVITETMRTLDADDDWINQTKRDLLISRYKVYDWLGMYLNGKCDSASKIMTHAYINSFGNVRRFIHNLKNMRDINN